MWIIPWCAVKHKQLGCEAFIFCASEKSLEEFERRTGGKREVCVKLYRGGVIKQSGEMLRCYRWHL